MAPLQWQSATIPFGGLSQRQDARTSSPPTLDVCLDAQFDLVGGIQTRHPYAALGNNIVGGGTLANCRRLVANGGELLCFTVDSLYSWSAELAGWVLKGNQLGAKIAQTTVFASAGDQHDCDRAELGGIVVYVWCESLPSGSQVFAAAADTVTGAIVVQPTKLSNGGGTTSFQPRVIALQTRILIVYQQATSSSSVLFAYSINPAAIAFSTFATISAAGTFGQAFDCTPIIGTDTLAVVANRIATTSYDVFKVTAALAVTSSNKVRTCTFPVAISASPSGTSLSVFRCNAGTMLGDLIVTSSLVDGAAINQTIGTSGTANPMRQIACAHRSVQVGGQWTCYVFWSNEFFTTPTTGNTNTFTDAGVAGTPPTFPPCTLAMASRAFDAGGRVYFWAVFAETPGSFSLGSQFQLQNTYFLYRDDMLLVAKACADNAAGWSNAIHLPGVALTAAGAYAWCGGTARIIALGGGNASSFAARAPADIQVTFDSNEARRAVRLGLTAYFTGGEVLAYDGTCLAEVGFHIYPWTFAAIALGSGGSLSAGAYAWKETWRWTNGKGETERSTTATVQTGTVVANDEVEFVASPPLCITHKSAQVLNSYGANVTTSPIAAEMWRTAVGPSLTAPFYLVSSKDPTSLTNPNRYLNNDPTLTTLAQFNDTMADATATTHETNPENSGVLSCLAPPAATIIAATEDRIFLAGIAGSPDTVWYSRQRNDGEIVSFNDGLTFNVPRDGGAITAIAFTVDGTVVVFRQTATYAFPGVGFDNTGGGQNFGPARILSTDLGAVSADAVVLTDSGTMFKSSRGWHMLSPSLQVQYIGASVYNYDAETVLACHVMTAQQQVRVMTSARVLVFDYNVGQWFEWTIADGVHACVWNGVYTYLTATGPKQEQASLGSASYGIDVETGWFKPTGDLSGIASVRWVMPLGEFRSACALRMRFARDYQYDGSGNPVWYDDATWPVTPTVVGSALQVRRGPSQPKCEAIKIRLTVMGSITSAVINMVTWTGALLGSVFAARAPGAGGNSQTFQLVVVSSAAVAIAIAETSSATVVTVVAGTPIAALEAFVTNNSQLAKLQTSDGSGNNITSGMNMATAESLAGGAVNAVSGESLRLTGIGLKFGVKPDLFNRLAAGQKV